jgi:hypothetical protein
MNDWKKAVVSSWKQSLRSLCVMLIPLYAVQWLIMQWGLSPFIAPAALGFMIAAWAAFQLLVTQGRLQRERAALDAKYDAKMAELIQDARTNPPRSDAL